MGSRKVSELDPRLQPLVAQFALMMAEKGLAFVITSTYRSPAEQDELFAQGRTKPGPIVTWTRNSKHNRRLAFDIALFVDRRASWDLKKDVNENEIPDYEEAGRIGEEVGLAWGGRWTKPDYCHFELKEGGVEI